MKEFSQLIWDQTRPVTLVYYETHQNNFYEQILFHCMFMHIHLWICINTAKKSTPWSMRMESQCGYGWAQYLSLLQHCPALLVVSTSKKATGKLYLSLCFHGSVFSPFFGRLRSSSAKTLLAALNSNPAAWLRRLTEKSTRVAFF